VLRGWSPQLNKEIKNMADQVKSVTTYPAGWDPYAWHDHHRPGKPRWRVKAGMFEERDALCKEFAKIHDRMCDGENSFFLVDEWHRLHEAILACEESEEN
jgi:hypothetical protein